MTNLRKCDDYLVCKGYLAAEAGGNCSMCRMPRFGEYEDQIRADDRQNLSEELGSARGGNSTLATADANARCLNNGEKKDCGAKPKDTTNTCPRCLRRGKGI